MVTPINMTAGEAIKALRIARGLSLRGLAQQAKISPAALSRWEAEKRVPNIPELEAVLTALEASPAQKRDILRRINAPRAVVHLRTLDQTGTEALTSRSGGDLLWAMRRRKGWTQAQTARAAQVAQAQIAWWENGDGWPNHEDLHTLCWCLNARPEEVAALSRRPHGGGGATLVYEAAHDWDNHQWEDYVRVLLHSPPPEDVFDLTFIGIEERLGQLAENHPFAGALLPNVFAIHARHHTYHNREAQAVRWAARGFVLQRQQFVSGGSEAFANLPLWFGNVLVMASQVAQSNKPVQLRRAAGLLRDYLPALRHDFKRRDAKGQESANAHHAWGQMTLANVLNKLHHTDEAIALGKAACEQGERAGSGEGLMRRRDFARLLLRANQPACALDTLAQNQATMHREYMLPDTVARHQLLEAECLAALDDKHHASERARCAEQIITAQNLLHLQAELRRVAAPL